MSSHRVNANTKIIKYLKGDIYQCIAYLKRMKVVTTISFIWLDDPHLTYKHSAQDYIVS